MFETLILSLCLGLPQEKPDDLVTAAKKVAEAGSYTYEREVRMEGDIGRSGRRGFSGIKGRYRKGVGLHVKMGDWAEFFLTDDSSFVKWRDRGWDRVAKEEEEGKGRRGGMSRWIRRIRPPHQQVGSLVEGVTKVERLEESEKIGGIECRVLEGALSNEAVRGGFVGGMLRRFGAGEEAEVSGSIRAWIGPEGALVRYRVRTRVGVELQGKPVEFAMSRTITFSGVGKTEVAVPEPLRDRVKSPTRDEKKEK